MACCHLVKHFFVQLALAVPETAVPLATLVQEMGEWRGGEEGCEGIREPWSPEIYIIMVYSVILLYYSVLCKLNEIILYYVLFC